LSTVDVVADVEDQVGMMLDEKNARTARGDRLDQFARRSISSLESRRRAVEQQEDRIRASRRGRSR